MDTPPEAGGSSSKARQASRSVSLLTPEQLVRKRAQDRESQRQTRLRVKQTIAELESRVEDLTTQLIATKLENDSLKAENQLAPPGSIPQQLVPGSIPLDDPFENYPGLDAVQQRNLHASQYMPTDSQFAESSMMSIPIGTEHEAPGLLDASLLPMLPQYLYDDFVRPISIPVWEARSFHYPPTCRVDKVLLGLVESRRPLNPIGGNEYEFTNEKFPAVAALLNPQHHASAFPLTTSIVSSLIYHLTIDNLPEQIAMMYLFCILCRWLITGSQEDYDAMPVWLRPGAAQIVTAHPMWVDLMAWPKARDRLCRDMKFHDKFEEFSKIANETWSINWPYNPGDCFITLSSKEYIVNPVFITHIRDLSNWTYGPSFFEAYPEFKNEINMGRPRAKV
ncbi:hypothetical protein F5882DRAFT_77230 [Hyaloscypha sp. PMI_1271]|nr:hypothetical protein F5882DRAFT_77230 [Hyaloscypha sp. PMI_1271]